MYVQEIKTTCLKGFCDFKIGIKNIVYIQFNKLLYKLGEKIKYFILLTKPYIKMENKRSVIFKKIALSVDAYSICAK